MSRWVPPWQSAAFAHWFGNSVVRNPDGTPKVVYHSGSFDEQQDRTFNTEGGVHFGTEQAAQSRIVGKYVDDVVNEAEVFEESGRFYLDDNEWPSAPIEGFDTEEDARTWLAGEVNEGFDPYSLGDDDIQITAVYLSIQNPKTLRDHGADWSEAVAKAQAQGYDGIVYRNEYEDRGSISYIVFSSTQIKSVNNRGTFDPNDPDILHGWAR